MSDILEFMVKEGIVYEMNGRWYIGLHGDTDITHKIDKLKIAPKGYL